MMKFINKKVLILLISSSITIAFIFTLNKSIPFETIAKGTSWGIDNQSEYIINDNEEWIALWDETFSGSYPKPATPSINFQISTVIAVFMGVRPSSGYAIEIKKISQISLNIEASIKEATSEGGSCVITTPYHIIITEKITLKVHFRRTYV